MPIENDHLKNSVIAILEGIHSSALAAAAITVEVTDEDSVTLCLQNKFLCDYFRDTYLSRVKNEISTAFNANLSIRLEYAQNQVTPVQAEPVLPPQKREERSQAPLPAFLPAAAPYAVKIRPEFTFENFAVGENNEIAHGAAVSLTEWHLARESSDEPIPEHRALLITGSVGLGKTHLLHACANFARQSSCDATPLYVPAEAFTNHFVRVIRSGDTKQINEFRQKYRETPFLLIDDVHFLAGKPKTEEELKATIDALMDRGSLIIFTAVQRLTSLDFRKELHSRMTAFTSVEIGPPDLALKIAIIQKKASTSGIPLADELATFIAQRTGEDIRSIEGIVKRLKASHRFGSRQIDIALLSEWFGENPLQAKRLSIASIKQGVAEYFEVSPSDLLHGGRKQPIVMARQVAMYLCTVLLRASASEIGRAFDKDHTTVLAAVSAIEKKLETDEQVQKAIRDMTIMFTTQT